MWNRRNVAKRPHVETLEGRDLLSGLGPSTGSGDTSPGQTFNPGYVQQATADATGEHLPFGRSWP